MALEYTYTDSFLAKRITADETYETRAKEEISKLGVTDVYYLEKLTILRAYMLVAIECMSDNEDIFGDKYKLYEKEYKNILPSAIASKSDDDTSYSLYSIPLYRV